ncbi:unnamed protein product [Hapterophycus canaliculatus]
MLSCVPVAAQQYLAQVFEAMSGPLRNKADAQVELMEDLADEMTSDSAVKEVFFSTGDIFFEIAQRLEAAAARAAGESAIAAAREEAMPGSGFYESTCGGGLDSQLETISDARRVSAAAAVLDAAFFHSMQFPKRVDLVGRPKPTSLPVVAENLVCVYSALQKRIMGHCNRANGGSGIESRNNSGGGVPSTSVGRLLADSDQTPDAILQWDGIMTNLLDHVVRALNGMSDLSIFSGLFNIENEHLGIVRNLVGVALGIKVRVGIQPAASDAQAFLTRVNDRFVGLIEELDRLEQKLQQSEIERKLAGSVAIAPTGDKRGNRKRGAFGRLTLLSLNSSSRTPLTPPIRLALPARQLSERLTPGFDSRGVGLQQLPEDSNNAKRNIGTGMSQQSAVEKQRREEHGELPSELSPLPSEQSFDPQHCSPREFLRSAPVLLHSYAKLLNALVCGSYNLRESYISSCEVDVRNIGRPGGYLDVLAGMDGGTPRLVFRQIALYLHQILIECHL